MTTASQKKAKTNTFFTCRCSQSAAVLTTASVPSVYTQSAKDKSIYPWAGVAGFLWLAHKEFWLASHPDNGAEPVCTAGGDIGVVHTADSSSTTTLNGGLGHTQL